MKYLYRCLACGPFESRIAADVIGCRCGREAKRVWAVSFDRGSTQHQGRWDPVVGEYVRNEREFRDALSRGRAAQEAELNREVKLVTLDARDTSGLAELHGQSVNEREHYAEQAQRARAICQ